MRRAWTRGRRTASSTSFLRSSSNWRNRARDHPAIGPQATDRFTPRRIVEPNEPEWRPRWRKTDLNEENRTLKEKPWEGALAKAPSERDPNRCFSREVISVNDASDHFPAGGHSPTALSST